MKLVGHGHGIPLELVSSVLEVAELAWSAVEHRRERKEEAAVTDEEEELALLRAENSRLKAVLAENLAVLRNVYTSPDISPDCPPDLHARLIAAVKDTSFLSKFETHQSPESRKICEHSDVKDKDADLNGMEVSVQVDNDEPSWWVWVTHEITPDCLDSLEEISRIDNENYVVITEENVVDGISNFIAQCILESPKSKNLTPEELRKAMTRILGGIKDTNKWKEIWEAGKVIYTLSTWGIALAGLYRHRAIVRAAAKGVGTSAKLVLKVL